MAEQLDADARAQALQFMTTEHFTLQTARSATIADTAARTNLFVGTVSSALVALAFIGQISELGTPFYTFSFVLLPTLCFLGLVTFLRTLQSTIEDLHYARAIARIRHFYLELAPQLGDYFVLTGHDDTVGALANMGITPSRSPLQLFLTTAGTIAVLDGVLAGVLAGLLLRRIAGLPLPAAVLGGVAVAALVVAALMRTQSARLEADDRARAARFPSPPPGGQPAPRD